MTATRTSYNPARKAAQQADARRASPGTKYVTVGSLIGWLAFLLFLGLLGAAMTWWPL